jgi:hypothetical protein
MVLLNRGMSVRLGVCVVVILDSAVNFQSTRKKRGGICEERDGVGAKHYRHRGHCLRKDAIFSGFREDSTGCSTAMALHLLDDCFGAQEVGE